MKAAPVKITIQIARGEDALVIVVPGSGLKRDARAVSAQRSDGTPRDRRKTRTARPGCLPDRPVPLRALRLPTAC
jgi:hypothetical protein